MEPVTHFLTGAVLSRAFFNRKTALATVTMVLAAEAPDIDMVAYFGGSDVGFVQHRGFTHTIIGIAVVSLVVVALVYAVHRVYRRWRPSPDHPAEVIVMEPHWPTLIGLSLVAGYSHILLDFTNNYGVRPFWPFNAHWYSWDIVFIVEPLILLALFGGLVLPALFGLINSEIGARSRGPRGRGGAVVALILILLIWGFRDYEHRRAIAALESQLYQEQSALRVSAYPYHTNPFKWHGVAETDGAYETMRVDSSVPEVDPNGRALTYYKSPDTEVTKAAKDSYLGRAYMGWAAYPLTEIERREHPGSLEYVVYFRDLRFAYPERKGTPLSAYVILDSRLNVTEEGFLARNPVTDRLETPSSAGEQRK
jgi:inner membrane protein